MFLSACLNARGEPVAGSSNACVPWWSFTKTLIAACILRLAEENRILLDERLPEKLYTPRQLLQHRAGLGDYLALREYRLAVAQGEEPWPLEEMLARADADRLRYRPGTGWEYSNVDYALLRRMVEDTCGLNFAEALRVLIFDPLGLPQPRLARTVKDMRTTAFPGVDHYHPGWVFHGVVVGPVVDAALALHGIMHGDLISAASRDEMLSKHPLGGAIEGRPWVTPGYGLGLMMGEMRHEGARPLLAMGHSAGGPGSVGAVYCFPEARWCRTVAVFNPAIEEGVAEHEALRLAAGE